MLSESRRLEIYEAIEVIHNTYPLLSQATDEIQNVRRDRWLAIDHIVPLPDEHELGRVYDEQMFRREIQELGDDIRRNGTLENGPHFQTWRIIRNDELLGDQVEFIERIGHGGTAEVWLAKSKHAKRSLAYKHVSDTHFSGKVRVALVVSELQNLFRVTHPNIVQIYEAGTIQSDDGRQAPFVLMEYIKGETLSNWRASISRMPKEEALAITAAIANALHFLHTLRDSNGEARPVFHLDVKPSNIMLAANGPILIDFGSLAHELSLGQLGTREYLATGRLDSHALPNASWDIFSLGGVLYFLLVGDHPLAAHPDPAERTTFLTKPEWDDWLCSINLGDPDLSLICRKCLAYDAADRYRTANEVEEDLSARLTDHPLPHSRKDAYSWWDLEKLLLKRCWTQNQEVDQWTLVGQACVTVSALYVIAGVIQCILTLLGFDVVSTFGIAANSAMLSGAGVAVASLIACKGHYFAFKVYIPFVVMIVATYISTFIFIPETPFKLTTEPELIRAIQFGWLMIGMGTAILSHNAYGKSWFKYTSWTLMFGALLVAPLASIATIRPFLPALHFLVDSVLVFSCAIDAFDNVRRHRLSV
jgi:hypothetical protein